jgi:hypothetical protein
MIRDIQLMCRFQEAVDERIKELTRLRDKGFISKRIGLGKELLEVLATSRTTLESTLGYKQAYRDLTYTSKVWGSVQWILDSTTTLPATAPELAMLARRLVFGITSYEALNTAWELLPWSWFIDWFAGVGDFISMHNNTVGVTWSKPCIMRTVTCESKYRDIGGGVNSPWFKVIGPYWERQVVKVRYVNITPGLPFTVTTTLPFLEWKKLSILGSLAVLKWKK